MYYKQCNDGFNILTLSQELIFAYIQVRDNVDAKKQTEFVDV